MADALDRLLDCRRLFLRDDEIGCEVFGLKEPA